jgi:hypothetical protein
VTHKIGSATLKRYYKTGEIMKIKAKFTMKIMLIASLLFLSGCFSKSCGGSASRDGGLAICNGSIDF